MNLNTGVYQIVNQINNKRYIGSSIDLKERIKTHFRMLKRNKHHSMHLQKSYNKYGGENFVFDILLFCDKENLIFYEQRAIDSYDFNKELYNRRTKAEINIGLKHSEETKRKMSKINIGKKASKETKKKISEASKRYRHSEEIKRKMSEDRKGNKNEKKRKKHSKESKKKMSKNRKGEKHHFSGKKGENNPLSKQIYQINKDTNEIIKKWYGIAEAERNLGIIYTSISKACNGKIKTAGGFKWKFIENYYKEENNERCYNRSWAMVRYYSTIYRKGI